eukprot:438273_1
MYDIVKHIMDGSPVTKTLIMDLLEKYYESYPYERLSEDFYIVKWEHIGNAMKHELHQKISETFMKIVNDKIKCKTEDDILTALKNKTRMSANEIKYIQQLMRRTLNFFDPFKNKNHNQECEVKSDQIVSFIGDNNVMNELNMNTLYDIYNVHNAFLFMNFNFQQYEPTKIFQNVQNIG